MIFEIRTWAFAPDGVKDVTVLTRGLDEAATARLIADIEAGRVVVPDEAVLAPGEHIEGCFLFKGGADAPEN